MTRHRFGLRGQLVIALWIAAALPLGVGLLGLQWLACRQLIHERGEKHQAEASSLIMAIQVSSSSEAEKLKAWIHSDEESIRFALSMSQQMTALRALHSTAGIERIDDIWKTLPQDDPLLRGILENPVSQALKHYQSMHPQAAEIFMTDAYGRLIASTARTSDYLQADESWWQLGAAEAQGGHQCSTVHYDESAQTIVVDVVLPIHHEGRLAGVLKMSIGVAQLLSQLENHITVTPSEWCFMLLDGRILSCPDGGCQAIANPILHPLRTASQDHGTGWLLIDDANGTARVCGFAALATNHSQPTAFAVVSSPCHDATAPWRRGFIWVHATALSLFTVCLLTGILIIQRKALKPLTTLETALQSVSSLARMQQAPTRDPSQVITQQHQVESHLHELQRIRAHEPLHGIIHQISTLISRVLRYQEEVDKVDQDHQERASTLTNDDASANDTHHEA